MQSPQALLLDLDGTLLDGSGNAEALERTCQIISAANSGIESAQLLKANAEAWAAYWPEVEQEWALGRIESLSVGLEVWRQALAACGVHDVALVRRTAELHWSLHREMLRLYDDAAQLFDELPNDLLLGLITSGASDRQRGALRSTGLESRLGVIIISGEIGAAKPDVYIFELALQGLGVKARDAWYVGDSLKYDVGGARGAGITPVWLNRTGAVRLDSDPKPDFEITSLTDLPALMGYGRLSK